MICNLVFYAYINLNNIPDYIYNHLFLLDKYKSIFNGRIIITIGTDDEINPENISKLSSLFSFFENAEIDVIKNDSENRESASFIEQLKKLKGNYHKESLTFYGHTKGSTYQFNPFVQKWMTSMYYFNLENLETVYLQFKDGKLFSGIFKLNFPCPPWVMVNHHYSGTFFWMNTDKLFSQNNWQDFQKGRFEVESYPGKFDSNLCGLSEDLFNDYINSTIPTGYNRYDLRFSGYWSIFHLATTEDKLNKFYKLIEEMNISTIKRIISVNPTAWSGHFDFAIQLIKKMQPSVTVELGVDYGYSIFAFAYPKLGRVYGIDWFQGDIHAGLRNVEQEVKRLCKEVENRLSINNIEIIKGDFQQIATEWTQTIDVLHIDGLHTYEAVKNDFETWSRFLNQDGCVLFHDIDCFQEVNQFFESLEGYKLRRSGSCGLGIWTNNYETFLKISEIENE